MTKPPKPSAWRTRNRPTPAPAPERANFWIWRGPELPEIAHWRRSGGLSESASHPLRKFGSEFSMAASTMRLLRSVAGDRTIYLYPSKTPTSRRMVLVYRGETMRLVRMRVTNFSSFKDTGWIEFSPGINLIVGQNNAGKTAFMHVFDQILEDNRHRNTAEYRQERLAAPSIEFDLDVSGHEVEDGLLMWMMTALPPRSFWWPVE